MPAVTRASRGCTCAELRMAQRGACARSFGPRGFATASRHGGPEGLVAQRGLSCRPSSASSPSEQLPAWPSSRTEAGGTPPAPASPVISGPMAPSPASPGLLGPCLFSWAAASSARTHTSSFPWRSFCPVPASFPPLPIQLWDETPTRVMAMKPDVPKLQRATLPARVSPPERARGFRVSARVSHHRLLAKLPPAPWRNTGAFSLGTISSSAVVAPWRCPTCVCLVAMALQFGALQVSG